MATSPPVIIPPQIISWTSEELDRVIEFCSSLTIGTDMMQSGAWRWLAEPIRRTVKYQIARRSGIRDEKVIKAVKNSGFILVAERRVKVSCWDAMKVLVCQEQSREEDGTREHWGKETLKDCNEVNDIYFYYG